MSSNKKPILLFFQPHAVPEKWKSTSHPRSRSVDDSSGPSSETRTPRSEASASSRRGSQSTGRSSSASYAHASAAPSEQQLRQARARHRRQQRTKLEQLLTRMLEKQRAESVDGCVVDASYLLEADKRLRKKMYNSKM